MHHRRLTRTQLRHHCRVHVFAFSFIRLRVAVWDTAGREGSARVVIFYSGGYAHQRRTGEPRGCGEYVYHRDWCLIPSGSSPRERGKLPAGCGLGSQVGFIPARAGKTLSAVTARSTTRAHPRAGGENRVAAMPSRPPTGSSPRGRGKLSFTQYTRHNGALIPARAGKTTPRRRVRGLGRAHPRAGGENRSAATPIRSLVGSSPRGRGKHFGMSITGYARGLIPARAGKTRKHPRT